MKMFKFLLNSSKKVSVPKRAHFRPAFLDTLRITVLGGHGGNGLPKYGGVGGQGGCVYCIAKEGVTLAKVAQKLKLREKRVAATHGEDSSKNYILGRRGVDESIEVPIGVQVFDDSGILIADLNEDNATCIVASGGTGGCSGSNFVGRPGEHRTVSLDLKLIADVGLVGFPNAGKSTFLKAVSNAKPKIAAYPFTTIRPQIGTIEYPDLRSITVADLPGLIEGAHVNFGMGHKFLKHIERTRLLLFMVDIFGFRLSPQHPQRDCLQNIYALNKELELYDPALLNKPSILLLNKMDKDGAKERLAKIKPTLNHLNQGLENCPADLRPSRLLKFERILPVSAMVATRIDQVKQELRRELDRAAEKKQVADSAQLNSILLRKVGERGPQVT